MGTRLTMTSENKNSEENDGSMTSSNIRSKRRKEIENTTEYDQKTTSISNENRTYMSEEPSMKTSINDLTKIDKNKVSYTFQWKDGGTNVVITGEFLNNWTTFITMIKNPETQVFEYKAELTLTKHYFKYIVDNKWICSSLYETEKDKDGNLNNYIDLTNYKIPPEELQTIQSKKREITENKLKESTVKIKNKNNIKSKEIDRKNKYDCKYPLINELNNMAPNITQHFKPYFCLDYQSNQNRILRGKYLKYRRGNSTTENNSYKKILDCPHEKLLHLCPNIQDAVKGDKGIMKTSVSIRNKHKLITIVYYKPKNIKE